MLIIPAIDIKDGKCVRLVKGDFGQKSIYNESPLLQAKEWAKQGANIIHIVDLDGALEGNPVNIGIIKKIIKEVECPVQIGGGIRSIRVIDEYIGIGIDRIIIGTQAYKDPNFVKEACSLYPHRIIVGIDIMDNNVAINGWKNVTETKGIDFAKKMESFGVSELIITDINRDGMLTGIDTSFYENFLDHINLPVIASGGVSTIEDILKLNKLAEKGLIGIIIGKALYENKFTLEDVLKEISDAGKKDNSLFRY